MLASGNRARQLPIDKKPILNEWGAVLQHQDELQRSQQQHEQELTKQLKLILRDSLDEQMEQKLRERIKMKEEQALADRAMMIAKEAEDQARQLRDEKKLQEVRDKAKKAIIEST